MSLKAAGEGSAGGTEDLKGFVSSLPGTVSCLNAAWNLLPHHQRKQKSALKLHRDPDRSLSSQLSDFLPPEQVAGLCDTQEAREAPAGGDWARFTRVTCFPVLSRLLSQAHGLQPEPTAQLTCPPGCRVHCFRRHNRSQNFSSFPTGKE